MTVNEASYNGENSFEYDGRTFGLEVSDDGKMVSENGEEVFMLSDIVFGAAQVGTVLSGDFYAEAQKAIRTNSDTFEFVNDKGENTSARINLVNGNYYIQTMQTKTRLDIDAPPSKQNPLGTDHYAFDVLTRLMYGGRVSLLVGFVVVFFEMFIGVIIGGISGYFGGWVDTILMRVVDLVNAVPFYPVVIILGTVFDHLEVDQVSRLFFLMVVLGIMGWTGIARVVRGQILSLREQDFMVATEATGVRISRRIFRHLIPNVMPLLIVNATMGLGGIIITEATLGFLGLGVKYPMASWGSIINEATDMYVMTNCWWIWIPAGLFILLTVLGFNFIGDGLRDAFDPKMKR
ncbi:MAG: ABC transporter permease [Lachnospiraceae bacterium]|nr:ABC transporter permease [Lachnospiraceae bacterium]